MTTRNAVDAASSVAAALRATDYHRLLLICGGREAERSIVLQGVAEAMGAPLVNVGVAVSEAMLSVQQRLRPSRASRALSDILPEGADCVVLDRIEVLFEPSLRLNPAALLRTLSRNRTVVAAWPGNLEGGRLTHAEPGHPEHLSEPADAVQTIVLE